MWFQQIIRTFFFSLDSTLFNFIPTVYDLLITISRTTILTQGQIKQFADRIQMLLGVFMLFKVSFSLITYIINPDDFSDKSKGFGKLWMNIIISLIMLVIVPYIFSMAYQLQGMLLEENTLATLILGETEESKNANYINTAGQKMAYTVMLPFFLPNSSLDGLNSCANLINAAGDLNDECFAAMQEKGDDLNQDGVDPTIENYKKGIQNQSLGLTFRLDIAKVTVGGNNGESQFLIDYKIPVSTVVAVVVLLLLISFCMDIALRSVKLSFLQLVYPIPVISFIDPKSGKDGIFKKWYEMCFKTYISLFVRLVALYFGVYVISKVNGMTDIVNGSQVTDFWVQIFIIIGVLMFMKQLPKILEGLGIKLDGDGKFQLNPFKKFEDEAFGGKQILGAGKGLAATALAAGAAGGTNLLNTGNKIKGAIARGEGKKGIAKAIGGGLASTIAGTLSGVGRGLTGTVKGKKFGEVYSNSYSGAMQARQKRDDRKSAGLKWYEPIGASVQKTLGMHTKADTAKKVEEDFKTFRSSYESAKKLVSSDETVNGTLGISYKEINKTLEQLNNARPQRYAWENDTQYEKRIQDYNARKKVYENELDKRTNELLDGSATVKIQSGGKDNESAMAAIKSYKETIDAARNRINRNAKSIDSNFVQFDPKDDYTLQYKKSGTSEMQFSSSDQTYKSKQIDNYSNGVGPLANNGKK